MDIPKHLIQKHLTHKDLDQMLKAAEEGHARLPKPTTAYEAAVHESTLHRARECIRLAKIGLEMENAVNGDFSGSH